MNITEPRQQRTPWRLLRANKEVINNICHLLTVAGVTMLLLSSHYHVKQEEEDEHWKMANHKGSH